MNKIMGLVHTEKENSRRLMRGRGEMWCILVKKIMDGLFTKLTGFSANVINNNKVNIKKRC